MHEGNRCVDFCQKKRGGGQDYAKHMGLLMPLRTTTRRHREPIPLHYMPPAPASDGPLDKCKGNKSLVGLHLATGMLH